jgi:hypothetical protein
MEPFGHSKGRNGVKVAGHVLAVTHRVPALSGRHLFHSFLSGVHAGGISFPVTPTVADNGLMVFLVRPEPAAPGE